MKHHHSANTSLSEKVVREAPLGICTLQGDDYCVVLANPAFERLTRGLPETADAFAGQPLAKAAPDLHAALLPLLEEARGSGSVLRSTGVPLPVRAGGGGAGDGVRYYSFVISPLDGGDLLVFIAETSERVLARKQAEEECAYLDLVLNCIHEAILVTGADSKVTLWNRAAEDLFGWKADEILGKDAKLLVTTSEVEEITRQAAEAVSAGKTFNSVLLQRRRDGAPVLIDTTVSALRGENGQIEGFVSSCRDITEKTRVENELRTSQKRLIAVLDHMPVGVWMMDKDGHIIMANAAAQRIWEGARYVGLEQVGEYSARRLETGEPLKKEDWAGYRAVKHGETSLNELLEIDCFDGSRKIIRNSAVPFYDEDELLGVVIVIEDVTGEYQTRNELARYAARLERSNRDLQDFAFVASHDLQEPLRKVKSFGELLKRRYEGQLDQEGQMYIDRMQQAALRMQAMIDDLLAFSRISQAAQPFGRVALEETAREAVANLDSLLEQTGGRVEIGRLPEIEADRRQIVQLFQNLIGNGIKFHRPDETPLVAVDVRRATVSGQVEISIRDNGIGFDVKQLDRIFQPFQRLHGRSEFEGNGIGLAICRRIVEHHAGKITASSTPGSGSEFVISLPVHQKKKDSQEESQYGR